MAGIGWLLDFSVAVAWTAWDAARKRSPEAPGIAPDGRLRHSPETRPLNAPLARMAIPLAVVALVGAGIAAVPWGQLLPTSDAAGMTVRAAVQTPERVVVVTHAPLFSESPPPADARGDDTGATVDAGADASDSPAPLAADAGTLPTPAGEVVGAAETERETPTATPTAAPSPEVTPTPTPTPSSTAEPAAAVAPAPTSAASQLTRAEVTSLALEAGWPADLIPDLLSVAWCESRFRPQANGWGAIGLMQIMPGWFTWLGLDTSLAVDPLTNLKVAQYIYQHDIEGGYAPWASWTCKPAGLPETAP